MKNNDWKPGGPYMGELRPTEIINPMEGDTLLEVVRNLKEKYDTEYQAQIKKSIRNEQGTIHGSGRNYYRNI